MVSISAALSALLPLLCRCRFKPALMVASCGSWRERVGMKATPNVYGGRCKGVN
jgi:hypothetical protein